MFKSKHKSDFVSCFSGVGKSSLLLRFADNIFSGKEFIVDHMQPSLSPLSLSHFDHVVI